MRKLNPWIVMTVVAALTGCVRADDKPEKPAKTDEKPAADQAPAASITPESPELAARIAALAQETLRQKVVVAPHFKEAAGLLMAAMRLDPKEPRYPRMLYEAMLQTRDNEGALQALKAYRATTADAANDQLAMVNYLDLSAKRLETAEERLDFYKKFLDSLAPEPVKSHVAFRAAQIARERGQSDLEDSFLGQALRLNPLNLDALRARLEALNDNGTPVERVGVLISMLKSNPVQPSVVYRLAREVADAGLVEDSLRFYTLAVNLGSATGVALGREFAMGYATELYMTGQPQLLNVSETIIEQLLKQDSGDVEALLLRWLDERGGGKKEAALKTQQQVVNAALNRVLTLRQQLGVTTATTRPVDSPEAALIPDLSEDVTRLKDDKYDELRVPYAQAVTDLAWYLVYVANQPAEAAKLLPALKVILSDKDPIVVRIEGWIFMAQGQFDQAGVKLKAVADQDVMAQAGTLLLWAKNPAEKDPAMAAARKLLSEHASGLLAALLSDGLKDLNIKLVPREDADPIKERIAGFDKNWLRIIDAPQNFYRIRAEMLGNRVLFPFGEPMMARVSITNNSPYDITIGPEGVIRNDLWFDAQLRGLVQQLVTGAAYERLSQVLVLKPGQTVVQTVRLDQGQLAGILSGNPQPSLTFYGQVRTNPRGDGGSNPGGYGVPFGSITERSGFSLNNNSLGAISGLLANGNTSEKLRSLELMTAEIELLRTQPATPESTQLIGSFLDAVHKSTADANAPVGTWAMFLSAAHDPASLPAMVEKLRVDPDPTRRVLGLLIANILPPDPKKQLVAKMLQDKDEMVRLYATGMSEIIQVQAAAATQPAGGATPPAVPADAPKP